MREQNNVWISVQAKQAFDGAEGEAIELVTEGRLQKTTGGVTLRYLESEVTGMEGTTTTIRVEGPRVTLLRQGQFNSQMVFEAGRRHLTLYETPYGALEVGVNTKRMCHDLTPEGGKLEIDYHLEIDHKVAGFNQFRVTVRPRSAISQ